MTTANEAGHAIDTSPGAGEAPHGAGSPETQPEPTVRVEPEPTPAPAAPPPQPRQPDGTFASPSDVPLDSILARPDVKAELNKAAKLAAKQAMEQAQEEARKAAERAKLDEVERLKLDMQEAEQRAAEATRKAQEAERERDLANTLIAGNVKLANPRALDFLRFNAFGLCDADPDLAMGDAVKRVLGEHGYLVAAETPPAPAAPEPAQTPAQPVERPSTAPPAKATQTPAAAKPDSGVDVLSMSKQEYEEYKRAHHPSIH